MGEEQKEIVRIESFCLILGCVVTMTGSKAVTSFMMQWPVKWTGTLFSRPRIGGTMISSVQARAEIIEQDYAVADWNIYPFHFSTVTIGPWMIPTCVGILKKNPPVSNQFSHGRGIPLWLGSVIKDLRDKLKDHDKMALEIKNKDAIYNP